MANAMSPRSVHVAQDEWEVSVQFAACCSLLTGSTGPGRFSVKWSRRQCSSGWIASIQSTATEEAG